MSEARQIDADAKTMASISLIPDTVMNDVTMSSTLEASMVDVDMEREGPVSCEESLAAGATVNGVSSTSNISNQPNNATLGAQVSHTGSNSNDINKVDGTTSSETQPLPCASLSQAAVNDSTTANDLHHITHPRNLHDFPSSAPRHLGYPPKEGDDDHISYVSDNDHITTISGPVAGSSAPLSMFVSAQPYGSSPYPNASSNFSTIDPHAADRSGGHGADLYPNSIQVLHTASSATTPDPKPDVLGKPDSHSAIDVDQLHSRPKMTHGSEDHRQDLLPRIKGMFRLLDLYDEQGSGGLVDKIIIAQDSLKELIDNLSAGAYTSITKINFAALDRVSIKAIGTYGSKSEIVKLLREMDAVSDETASILLHSDDDRKASQPSLRSGIYLLVPSSGMLDLGCGFPATVHVIYWPEDATWDDAAAGNVKRNRVTFMRYLTRLTDQIRVLVSPEHANSFVWKAEDDTDSDFEDEMNAGDDGDSEDGDDDRFFKFEVAKTHEQEEDAQVHPGFSLKHQALSMPATPGSFNDATIAEVRPPVLVAGEKRRGFMTTTVIPGKDEQRPINETYARVRLASMLKTKRVYLEDSINEDALDLLMSEGLSIHTPALEKAFREDMSQLRRDQASEERVNKERASEEVKSSRSLVERGLGQKILDIAQKSYPMLGLASADGPKDTDANVSDDGSTYLSHLYGMIPDVQKICDRVWRATDLSAIDSREYKRLKKRFVFVQAIIERQGDKLHKDQRDNLIRNILSDEAPVVPQTLPAGAFSGSLPTRLFKSAVSAIIGVSEEEKIDQNIKDFVKAEKSKPDPEFLRHINELSADMPMLIPASEMLYKLAQQWVLTKMQDTRSSLLPEVQSARLRGFEEQIKAQSNHQAVERRKCAVQQFRKSFNAIAEGDGSLPDIFLSDVRKSYSRYLYTSDLNIVGHSNVRVESVVRYRVWPIELTEQDNVALRADPMHVSRPKTRPHSIEFTLPQDCRVRHVQLLRSTSDNYLVVADTPRGTNIWLRSEARLFAPQPTKQLQLANQYVLAVDETKRLVAFIHMDNGRCILHVFVMDETLTNLSSRSTPVDVTKWYSDGPALIRTAVFFPGTEELCLVEQSGRVRIYSFMSQGFRPASIQLPAPYDYVQCAPDASALLVVEGAIDGVRQLRVYHRASFGTGKSLEGIVRNLPANLAQGAFFAITSLGQQNTSLLCLLPEPPGIVSVSVQISRKETEYQFRAKEARETCTSVVVTKHNSLLDCFSEVWGRYPVVPAIKRSYFVYPGLGRETVSADGRLDPAVTFVANNPCHQFTHYFKNMIRQFERLSRKPTDRQLDRIKLRSVPFQDVDWNGSDSSVFRAGEWLVELLCLIPIHIAIARENRFVPLKDGVFDPRLEQQLLGAEVSKIINTLSLGWYESIFGSYLAAKEVKVISSMGEQSVGKSYSLNHIVDSSFAGSAVRTTEGVWLSVCPSKDILVVALDFEGVHSIERTAQEDMLLVLFNTALSNLVIFRNNFALSRDVANMFTSFQASTHIFDPASNPKLFKGLLAVVIKSSQDVVDSDKKEIVQEFRTKFHQIVNQEQEENFITKLHDSQLTVIPWNVIESREFYTLFSKLSKQLFKQKTTHGSAGEFLMTLKTLMAKLKAQDWGAMDQTLVKHRCALLSASLLTALATGYAEVSPVVEELKNFDNQEVIPSADSNATFYIGKTSTDRQEALRQLLVSWHPEPARYNVKELVQHINTLAQTRLTHVASWMSSNISRFQADNADIRALKREYEELSEALKANAQPCLMELLDTGDGTYVMETSTYAVSHAISTAGEAAKVAARNRSSTWTTSTCVPLEATNAESSVICRVYQRPMEHAILARASAPGLS
ncbi:hypothetical protein FRB96_007005 [Tulasnella sp. 330]|nr:hypothetical protein FRB96_007005 [Tulasnella sp. 330]